MPLAIASALLIGGGAVASAGDGDKPAPSPTSSQAKPAVEPAAVVKGRVLKTTAISQENGSAAVPGGFQPIDAVTTLSCPGAASTRCTFEAHQNVQVQGSTAGNSWAICTQVDGVFMNQPNCPFLGQVPNGSFGAGSFVQTQTGITPGNHTVQTFLFTNNGATRSIYTIEYRVYKP